MRRLVHSQYCNLTAFVLSCGLSCPGVQLATDTFVGIRQIQKTLIVGEIQKSLSPKSSTSAATDWPELLSDYKDRTPS